MKTPLEKWLETVVPDDHSIIGRNLKPFSLGHAIILHRLGNAFMDADRAPGYADLLEAVFVCSHSACDVRRALDDRWLKLRMWFWRRRAGNFHIGKAVQAFVDYMQSHSVTPETKSGEDAETGRTPGGPFLLRIKLMLQAELGYSEAEALAKPMGQAIWEVCAWLEMKSDRMQILNDAETQQTDADVIAEFMAKLNKEEAGSWHSLS